jgi:serine/threonine-protein kinase RsbT
VRHSHGYLAASAAPRMSSEETVVQIASSDDIVTARRLGRALGSSLGFAGADLTVIATAISELGCNMIEYASNGAIVMTIVEKDGRPGIKIVARDEGPGIPDLAAVLANGHSTGQHLGVGLSGVRRLMDEFEISSSAGEGTSVTVREWVP